MTDAVQSAMKTALSRVNNVRIPTNQGEAALLSGLATLMHYANQGIHEIERAQAARRTGELCPHCGWYSLQHGSRRKCQKCDHMWW